jgi:hypothetical protein
MSERRELIRDTVRCSPQSGELLTGAPLAAMTWTGRHAWMVHQ